VQLDSWMPAQPRPHRGVPVGGIVVDGYAACEPATTVIWQARKQPISHEQSPPDDS
jgi:hypothetical protein